MITLTSLILALMIFIMWNNWPDLVERVGTFLVAHAQAIRSRKTLAESIRRKVASETT